MEHKHEHEHNASENIKVAFLLNLGFSILEAIGGFLTNSISIFTDSIHDFGDSISIGVSYLLEKQSNKDPNHKYTYGYLRYSLLGALITSIILLTGSVVVIYNAIPRIIHPEEINHDAMIIFAIFGVIINGYAAYRTSHGEKHNEGRQRGRHRGARLLRTHQHPLPAGGQGDGARRQRAAGQPP